MSTITKTTKIDDCGNNSSKSVMLNFSIDHILKKAGGNCRNELTASQYEWLQCSRYCPPKIQKSLRKDNEQRVQQKRRLGNHPRIPFTKMQLFMLEDKFKQDPYLSGTEVKNISTMLEISERRVKIWFQNRRAKQRRESNDNFSTEDCNSLDLANNSQQITLFSCDYHQQQHQLQQKQFNESFDT